MLIRQFLRPGLIATAIVASSLNMAPTPVYAAESPIYTGFLSNLAVNGYDPVAYFTEGQPIKGSADHALEFMGAEWRFASAENLESFRLEPQRYAPQYGGYCAWAVAQGGTSKGDPLNWRIVDGKLYLNYNAKIQERWEQDISGNIRAADQKWPQIIE